MKLDEKDIEILSELKRDSRQSIRDIAKKTDIRPSTVHLRINQLIKQGVIERFTLKLNNKAIGENFIVFVLVKANKEIDKKVFNDSHVKEVFGITGEYDMMIKLKFSDIEEFNGWLLKFRRENELGSTITMVSTLTIKEEL